MIRWLFNVASFLSLLLLVAALALWVRGYRAADQFWLVYRDDGAETLRSARGRLAVRHLAPNVRGIPVPRRVSHWWCPPGSQLPPKPSPMHWQWAVLTYEGTPAPTPEELESARAVLKEAEAARGKEADLVAALERQMPRPGLSDGSMQQHAAWVERQYLQEWRLRQREEQARIVLEGTHFYEWSFPAWLAAAGFAVLPGVSLALRRRRRTRLTRGLCPDCGYDLRASTDRCPECGLVVRRGAPPMAPPPHVSRPTA